MAEQLLQIGRGRPCGERQCCRRGRDWARFPPPPLPPQEHPDRAAAREALCDWAAEAGVAQLERDFVAEKHQAAQLLPMAKMVVRLVGRQPAEDLALGLVLGVRQLQQRSRLFEEAALALGSFVDACLGQEEGPPGGAPRGKLAGLLQVPGAARAVQGQGRA